MTELLTEVVNEIIKEEIKAIQDCESSFIACLSHCHRGSSFQSCFYKCMIDRCQCTHAAFKLNRPFITSPSSSKS